MMNSKSVEDVYCQEASMSLLDKDSSEGENITSDMYEHLSQRQPRKSYCRTVLPWATTTMLSLCLSIYLGLTLPKVQQPGPFDTDLPALHSAVVYEERAFTRELSYDPSSGRVIRIPCDREPEYFGEPNETVDAAWEDLMRNRWLSMTPAEAASYDPELSPLPWDGQFRFEPDMFHSLHCLNSLPLVNQDGFERIHIDHCMDQIRQTIQCHGDLSPVLVYAWKGFELGIGRGTKHSCRKWEPIRKWMDDRNEEYGHLPQ